MKAGFANIVGVPNAGKSTLINRIIGEKISIVTHKVQTTRKNVKAIFTKEEYQIVFIDTPGFHSSEKVFNFALNKEIFASFEDVDLTVFIIDISTNLNDDEIKLIENLKQINTKTICLFNKFDKGKNDKKFNYVLNNLKLEQFFFVSAINLNNIDSLCSDIKNHLPESPSFLYSPEYLTEETDRDFVSELIREKITQTLQDELPYSIYVEVIKFKEKENAINISADISVERDSQKGIVIGNKGKNIKKIRRQTELELEKIYSKRIRLTIFVKIDKNWTKNVDRLIDLGYDKDYFK